MQTIRMLTKAGVDGSLSLNIPLDKPEARYEVVVVLQPMEDLATGRGSLEIRTRLDELRALKDGWIEGSGTALSESGLDWCADAFAANYPEHVPPPRLFPTPHGGIQAEWSFDRFELSLEIDLASHHAHWHCLDSKTHTEETRELHLDRDADWHWLVARVTQLARSEG